MDRGPNGGLVGSDMLVLYQTHGKINVVGNNDHGLTGLSTVIAAVVHDTNKGPVIVIFHEYAHPKRGAISMDLATLSGSEPKLRTEP